MRDTGRWQWRVQSEALLHFGRASFVGKYGLQGIRRVRRRRGCERD